MFETALIRLDAHTAEEEVDRIVSETNATRRRIGLFKTTGEAKEESEVKDELEVHDEIKVKVEAQAE